jgi:hypothetical protein
VEDSFTVAIRSSDHATEIAHKAEGALGRALDASIHAVRSPRAAQNERPEPRPHLLIDPHGTAETCSWRSMHGTPGRYSWRCPLSR